MTSISRDLGYFCHGWWPRKNGVRAAVRVWRGVAEEGVDGGGRYPRHFLGSGFLGGDLAVGRTRHQNSKFSAELRHIADERHP
jgi:hypothetical protein